MALAANNITFMIELHDKYRPAVFKRCEYFHHSFKPLPICYNLKNINYRMSTIFDFNGKNLLLASMRKTSPPKKCPLSKEQCYITTGTLDWTCQVAAKKVSR